MIGALPGRARAALGFDPASLFGLAHTDNDCRPDWSCKHDWPAMVVAFAQPWENLT